MILPVILAGGKGTRLWPLSRESFPKQLLPLVDGKSLFELTLDRCKAIDEVRPPLIITSEDHRFLLKDLLEQNEEKVLTTILEPQGKSTAPAVALAAMCAMEATGEDPLLLVLPADHIIDDKDGFVHSVLQGVQAARKGHMVTFGIQPQYPETGYGYIHASKPIPGLSLSKVEAFIEKPELNVAQGFVKSGDYYWNSGMFLFQASAFLAELEKYAPEMLEQVKQAWQTKTQEDDGFVPGPAWQDIKEDSIDYAVMEKTQMGALFPLQSTWQDVGSWSALSDVLTKNEEGNTKVGDVFAKDTHQSLLVANKRMIAAVGLKDIVVVETPDVVLVADKNHSQALKPLVSHLKEMGRKEVINHSHVHRPWGSFESIDQGARYQVKRITVNVGAALSLQMHHHRSEHWVVVRGTARVTRGEEVFLLSENQSTYIPIGEKHRLENIGKIPLEIIEVQSGSYLGEDDIIRFDDQYGRSAGVESVEETQEDTQAQETENLT